MKTAHLILAHTDPVLLARLVKRLEHPDAVCYVHVDRKADIRPFTEACAGLQVHMIRRRVAVYWGAYSIIQATLNGFREILASSEAISHINLISGQDYPILPPGEICRYFDNHREQSFMRFLSVNDTWQEAIPRLRQYHFTHYRFPGRHFLQRVLARVLPDRRMPHGMIPVGRSQWMTLSIPAVRYITGYLQDNPGVARFFKLTWAPDELIFQTILYNSPLRDTLVNDDLRYVDWSEGKPSPKTLTMEDKDRLLKSGKFFARKFDGKHPEILDELDRCLDGNIASGRSE